MLGDPELSKELHQNQVVEPGHDDRYGRACKTYFVLSGFGGLLFSHLMLATLPGPFIACCPRAGSLIVAVGLVLGVLAYLSKRSYKLQYDHERSRESWEMENFPDGERKEMIELFEAQGLDKHDATTTINTLSKDEYKPFFIDLMMMQEIGMANPALEPNALYTGAIVGATFICVGFWPIFIAVLAQWWGFVQDPVSSSQMMGLLVISSSLMMMVVHAGMDCILPQHHSIRLYFVLALTSAISILVAHNVQENLKSFLLTLN